MELSEILNVVFGTGLVATVVGFLNIRNELRRAQAEARRAEAEADTVKITNTDQATRILIENIVEPLREELDATRKELSSVKREVARLRKAMEAIPQCPYHGECPVLDQLSEPQDAGDGAGKQHHPNGTGSHRIRDPGMYNQVRKRRQRKPGNPDEGDTVPAGGCGVHEETGPDTCESEV